MMKYLIILTLLLSGCAGYEFGDGTRAAINAAGKIITLKREYCSDQSVASRELILLSIHLVDPGYDGVCEPAG